MKNKLIEGAKTFGITLSEQTADALMRYMELLREWNEKINLTAITEPSEVITKHFLDCLSVFNTKYIKDTDKVIDVGTGAGFPGLVMKIAKPTLEMTLLDSLEKRLNFLKEVCEQTKTENVNFVHARAEDGGRDKNLREKFDVAVARAVANMSTLCEYTLPFVKTGGYLIALKGPLAGEELDNANAALEKLGGKLENVEEVTIPYTDLKHKIVIVKKVKPTPSCYPRKAGTPSKKPL